MKNNRGEVLENTFEGPAIEYIHGSGNILPELETELEGLAPGNERTIIVVVDKGNEHSSKNLILEVLVEAVRNATNQEWERAQAGHHTICGPDCIC